MILQTDAARRFDWRWQGRPVQAAYENVGGGRPVLLLPAFSTVCSREEMRPLADRLAAAGFGCTLLDWPGFGSSDRGRLDYGPALFRSFLADFAAAVLTPGTAAVAAGHAAGYALALGHAQPGLWRRLVLAAPTWRQNGMAAFSAEGGTVWVLMRRSDASCRHPMALVVRADLHWLGGRRKKANSRSPAISRLAATAGQRSRHLHRNARRRSWAALGVLAQHCAVPWWCHQPRPSVRGAPPSQSGRSCPATAARKSRSGGPSAHRASARTCRAPMLPPAPAPAAPG